MPKLTKTRLLLLILSFLLACVIGPVVINVLYLQGGPIRTVWSGGEFLDFYGSLLGSLVGAVTLALTIWFAIRQNRSENNLQLTRELIADLERRSETLLYEIHPMMLDSIFAVTGKSGSHRTLSPDLLLFEQTAAIQIDYFRSSISAATLNMLEYTSKSPGTPQKHPLEELLEDAETVFQKEIDIRNDFYRFYRHSHPDPAHESDPAALSEWNMQLSQYWLTLHPQLTALRQNEYAKLLQKKSEVFLDLQRCAAAKCSRTLSEK